MAGISLDHTTGTLSAGEAALTLNGVGQVQVGQQFKVQDGSLTEPSITNYGDENTGIYFPAQEAVALVGAGVELLRVDGTANKVFVKAPIDGGALLTISTSNTLNLFATSQINIGATNVVFDASWGSTGLYVDKTTNKVKINNAYTLPLTAGTSGQVITSDGTGGSTWSTPSGGGGGGSDNTLAYYNMGFV